jgi:hypothetical protein
VRVEVGVIFLVGKANDVEITDENPGDIGGGVDHLEFIKESLSVIMGGRAVNVSNIQGEIRGSGGEANGEGVVSKRGRVSLKDGAVPGGKNTPGSAIGGDETVVVVAAREERVVFWGGGHWDV